MLSYLFAGCSGADGSAPDGRTEEAPRADDRLLTRLPASYTGVRFENRLVDTQDLKVLTYRNSYNGGGVALGDLTGDGLPGRGPGRTGPRAAGPGPGSDGRLDLLLAGNFDGFKPEMGRMAAGSGLILRGTGEGGFEALRSRSSGFLVPGEARDIQRLGTRTGELYVVTRSDDAPLLFRTAEPRTAVAADGDPGVRTRGAP